LKHRTKIAGRFAMTGVALAASFLLAGQALALGLGRLTVQSALGETLRAEIDVTDITPEEAATLQLRVASPDVYRAAGVDYNAVLPTTQATLQRRPDGRAVVRVSSDRAVVEPFLDVILEVNWASGRLVRAYTLLLDPPASRVAPPTMAAAPTAPVITPAPRAAVPAPVTPPPPAPAPAPAPAPVRPPPERSTTAVATPTPPSVETVRVVRGDTLSGIASRVRPEGVSLDQMLVSLFRANPDAFMGDNMNRLKAGVVLSVPEAGQVGQVDASEARQIIVAQSADFSAYRQRLAGNVAPVPATEAPTRQAAGTVQAEVRDRGQVAQAPDQLRLSQGSVQASAPEASVSRQAQQSEAAARVAELARNVEELKRLQNEAAAPVPAPAVAAAPAPAVAAAPATAPAAAPETPPAPAPAAPPPPPAAAPTLPVTPPAPAPAPAPAPSPGFIDSLLDNPLLLPGAGVLVALLLGLGLYRLRGRMRKPAGETSFLESRLQPDSFFGASGGQRVDTREAASSSASSSMSYSLSQLDAIGDVDPVAEADVYLAYGRDLQAEEILKEAMRATPDRQAIRVKLLEVYAKRRDTKGFELLATQLFSMTQGQGEDWEKAQEIGRSLDPENPLYQPGGQPDAVMMSDGKMIEPLGAATLPHSQRPTSSLPSEVSGLSTDLDLSSSLDLDLDVDSSAPTTPGRDDLADIEATQPLSTGLERAPDTSDEAMIDFDLPAPGETGPGELDFELPVTTEAQPRRGADRNAPSPSDFSTLDFDLEPPTIATDAPGSKFQEFQPSGSPDDLPPISEYGSLTDDPLARKLELAEEFRQIGDMEGARDLLEEVVAKADGALKAKAQGMLDRLA
jgi:pilus assembly protein FimV